MSDKKQTVPAEVDALDTQAVATPANQAEMSKSRSSKENEQGKTPFLTRLLDTLFSPDTRTIAGAIIVALFLGALLVVLFNPRVQETMTYLFARPQDFFEAVWTAFSAFFTSLVRGSLFDWQAESFARMIRPLTESLVFATPLIISGLAITVAFRAGLFNIGVQGQLIIGAMVGTMVGVNLNLPPVLGLIITILGAILGGALWGAIPGFLKSRLGANEVIVTIMLNTIALYLAGRLLQLPILIGEGLPSKSLTLPDTT